jgi:hypothetical protein
MRRRRHQYPGLGPETAEYEPRPGRRGPGIRSPPVIFSLLLEGDTLFANEGPRPGLRVAIGGHNVRINFAARSVGHLTGLTY